MASYFHLLFKILASTICISLLHFGNALPEGPAVDRRFIMPVIKDLDSPYYKTVLQLGQANASVELVIDLGIPMSWLPCDTSNYKPRPSTTYQSITCGSYECMTKNSRRPNLTRCGHNNKLCTASASNPWSHVEESGRLGTDRVMLYSGWVNDTRSGYRHYQEYPVLHFPFICTHKALLKGLPEGVQGILSLSQSQTAPQYVLYNTFNIPRKFAVCLDGDNGFASYNGAVLFGGGPYYVDHEDPEDHSKSLITTPIWTNLKRSSSFEYYIMLRAIEISGIPLKFNHSLLEFDNKGFGATTLSLSQPYTTLHTDIYNSLIYVFVSTAVSKNITKVAPVAPFKACFQSDTFTADKWEPSMSFVLEGKNPSNKTENARWNFGWRNLMVNAAPNVVCLGILDGGVNPKASIIIGGKQMEAYFVEIDLESWKLGLNFAPLSMLGNCAQFYETTPR